MTFSALITSQPGRAENDPMSPHAVRRLSGKAALITGGSTETAHAVAVALAVEGADICITGLQAETLERTAESITAKKGHCLAFPADVTLEGDVECLTAAALEAFGRLDILVLISAVWGGGAIHEHKISTWDRIMASNLRANFLLARAFLPVMRKHGGGEVVFIASESALGNYPGDGAYGVSMHALLALADLVRLENQDASIRVSTLCPGVVQTPVEGPGRDAFTTPEDVTRWVVWLVTNSPDLVAIQPIKDLTGSCHL